MIVPMLKYAFLVFHADYQEFLKSIKKLGVLHIYTKSTEQSPEIQDNFRTYNELVRTIRILEEKEKSKTIQALFEPNTTADSIYENYKEFEKQIEHNNHLIAAIEKELLQLQPWGDYSIETIEKLKTVDIQTRFLICKEKKYNTAWENSYNLFPVSTHSGFVHFVVFQKNNENIDDLLSMVEIDEITLPSTPLSLLIKQKEDLELKNNTIHQHIAAIATHHIGDLHQLKNKLQSQLDDSNAYLQTEKMVDNYVMLIEGYVPVNCIDKLNEYLAQRDIVYITTEPKEDEKVPVLLKNNRFNKVFEFIGNLYELPNHKELDLTPFFAPFYMLFFGFSLGDAGYGLIIVLAATILKYKKPAMRSILTLAQFLGISTVIFGALTGTLFGIDLINADIAWLENAKQYMINTDKMFTLALTLGVIQILFGMSLKVVNISISKGFNYALSTIGWLILIIGLGANYILSSLSAYSETVSGYTQNIVLLIAAALILVFNNPKRSIIMNVLAGLWDVYGMVTGLIGDLLSYIRLFALGVSSAILGFVFNELAMSLRPDNIIFGPIVMIIILVLGHGMTLFMAALGAFVHPIRLTFVEFYKNAGFVGGGKAYNPFAEKKEN